MRCALHLQQCNWVTHHTAACCVCTPLTSGTKLGIANRAAWQHGQHLQKRAVITEGTYLHPHTPDSIWASTRQHSPCANTGAVDAPAQAQQPSRPGNMDATAATSCSTDMQDLHNELQEHGYQGLSEGNCTNSQVCMAVSRGREGVDAVRYAVRAWPWASTCWCKGMLVLSHCYKAVVLYYATAAYQLWEVH